MKRNSRKKEKTTTTKIINRSHLLRPFREQQSNCTAIVILNAEGAHARACVCVLTRAYVCVCVVCRDLVHTKSIFVCAVHMKTKQQSANLNISIWKN